MFNTNPIIVGLEIGTAKVAAVVGEVNPAGALSLIGIGQSASRGVRKGEVRDFRRGVRSRSRRCSSRPHHS